MCAVMEVGAKYDSLKIGCFHTRVAIKNTVFMSAAIDVFHYDIPVTATKKRLEKFNLIHKREHGLSKMQLRSGYIWSFWLRGGGPMVMDV